jgi:O-acetylhomoserine/O-acetylserine sulfhydrylase-like pyridoxal-dependent enzyme
MGYDSKGILLFKLHQFGQIYKLLSNATVNIIEIVRNCVR